MTTGDYRLGDLQRFALMKSDDSGVTWYPVYAPVGAGGGGATPSYTEGATDSTIDGVAMLWEDTGDTLRSVSAAKPLPVNIVAGSSAGTQYTEGAVDATIDGVAFMWEDASDTLRAVSAAKPLPVAQQGSVAVTGTFWQATQPVSGTFWQATQPVSGPLTDTQLRASAVPVSLASVPSHAVTNAGTFAVQADTELPAAAALADATANPTVPTVGTANLLYNGTTWDRQRGDTTNGLDVDVTRLPALVAGSADIGGVNITKVAGTATAVNSGNKDAGTQRVVIATDQPALTTPMPTAPVISKGSTATVTQVACSTTSAQLLASNSARKGAAIFNDTAVVALVKFGTTASTTSFTVKLPAGTVYDLSGPEIYYGRIDCVLASSTGNVYATEW